jgi:rSAM/selenodomain-associated transferase 2/rSAM/selenodomain-associated transferase 1
MRKRFSIIIPVLHESPDINDLIGHLQELENAKESELIVVDGSPEGDTINAIAHQEVRRLTAPPGRARQMNAGAAAASGDILLFLHADTRLPADALTRIDQVMKETTCPGGAFKLGIPSPRWIYRLIAVAANARSRLTRIPYGDQAIFIRKDAFRSLGCYPEIPLMEDVALMQRIKQSGGRIRIIPRYVATSPRRWEEEGILYTTLRNWLLITAYCLGVPPDKLVRHYGNRARPDATEDRLMEAERRTTDCCILLFVKSPQHVPVKSRLAASIGGETARELYKNFVLDILETLSGVAAKTGCVVCLCVHPSGAVPEIRKWLGDGYRYLPQKGKDLGERMKNAFLDGFADGYGRAIILGSDAPDLTGEIITEGINSLGHGEAVIGPAHDGGYYLIGFRSDTFLPAVFEDISWSTGNVFAATMEIFRHARRHVSVLPSWRDIDTLPDLKDLRERHQTSGVVHSRTIRYLRSRDGGTAPSRPEVPPRAKETYSASTPEQDDPAPAVHPKQ